MAKKRTGKSLRDLESLYAFGENPKGFTSQTPNGTSHWNGTGWNQEYQWESPEAPAGGAWQPGRSNRTAE